MGRCQPAIEDLRTTVACLPRHTKTAMLEGIRTDTIIAGAYTDGDGGICPMLSAHRRGGRTDLLAFARAWDRFTRVEQGRGARVATHREVAVLEAQLEGALLAQDTVDLGGAVAEHQAAARERRAREAGQTGIDWLHAAASTPVEQPEEPGAGERTARRERRSPRTTVA